MNRRELRPDLTYPKMVSYGIDPDEIGHECDTGCTFTPGCPEANRVSAGNRDEDGAGVPDDLKGPLTNTAPKWEPKVASRCCVCGRELLDATSIEFGIGPVCRKKYRYEDAYPVAPDTAFAVSVYLTDGPIPEPRVIAVVEACHADDSRRAANVLVHVASTESAEAAVAATHALRLLGYTDLADKVQDRLCAVKISEQGGYLAVQTPWNPAFVSAVRGIAGRRWDGDNKVNLIPVAQKRALYDVLVKTFPGAQGVGPKGPFTIAKGA